MTEGASAAARSATPLDADYDALIGLGSNLGDKAANIRAALDHLAADGAVRIVRVSRFWQSAPWGVEDQDWFVNACAAVATGLAPNDLLRRCLAAEDALGRVRVEKWGPRVVDVDVLTYRGETIDTPDLKVPHPYIEARAFVLVPLAEIAPDEVVRGRRVGDLAVTVETAGLEAIEA